MMPPGSPLTRLPKLPDTSKLQSRGRERKAKRYGVGRCRKKEVKWVNDVLCVVTGCGRNSM